MEILKKVSHYNSMLTPIRTRLYTAATHKIIVSANYKRADVIVYNEQQFSALEASLHLSKPQNSFLFVQQPVQQRRRKTAHIGDTQRTAGPGNKHVESISEHERTFPSVSRMRYRTPILKRLEPLENRLEAFRFLGIRPN